MEQRGVNAVLNPQTQLMWQTVRGLIGLDAVDIANSVRTEQTRRS